MDLLLFLCTGSVVVLFILLKERSVFPVFLDDPTLAALNHGGLSMYTTQERKYVRHRRTSAISVVLSLVQKFGIRACACMSVQ